ncbi:MAG: 3-methyl-2-oxobutanoate hydroxymethyltransferase [Gaiellaceae bacterium]
MSSRPRTSSSERAPKVGLRDLERMKAAGEKIVMITAYDYPSGRLADQAGLDTVLVGDSAAMTVLGHDSTVPITLDEMVVLSAATVRGARRPFVLADLPFGSYQVSDEDAVRSAIRMTKEAGVDMVKVEGAGSTVSRVRAIVDAGVPVCGHLGLTPQSATLLGGYKAQGRSADKALQVIRDAHELEAAGASLLVLEAIPPMVAARVSASLSIPTIGIGAGADCDGQVLVYHDVIGLTDGMRPRFVRQYAAVGEDVAKALASYASDVKSGSYPKPEHEYTMPDDELAQFDAAEQLGRS